jgi:hypothetical protein
VPTEGGQIAATNPIVRFEPPSLAPQPSKRTIAADERCTLRWINTVDRSRSDAPRALLWRITPCQRYLNTCATGEEELCERFRLLLGPPKVASTVRYLGIEVDDALAIAEQVDV